MFIRETYAAEYIEEYIDEHIEQFQRKENLYIYTVCEQGINLLELFRKKKIDVCAFLDDNPKVCNKIICGIPVLGSNQVKTDYYVVVSSATTAWHDRDVLKYKGYDTEKVFTIFPAVTEYYSRKNLEIDKMRYAGRTKEENDLLAKKELEEQSLETHAITTQLIMDLTSKCNLNCRHCEAHHDKAISKIRNMEEDYTPVERYQFLLDYAHFIYLNISGEPLMSQRFWDILDYVDQSNNQPELFTVTNGILLDQKAADRIVESKFRQIYISMDGASTLTYKRLRGGDFDLWCKNIKYLADRRTERGKNLKIVLQHTVSRESLEETRRAIEIAEELGVDRIVIRPLYEEIAGKDNWRVPMDEDREYYYLQQMTTYYPHLTKQMIDEAREYAKDSKVSVEISDRFDANLNMEMEDFPYPISVEDFQERLRRVPQQAKIIEEVPERVKDYVLCNQPWNLTLFFVNGTVMHCNRMVQMEGNINFSPLYELHNNKLAQDIRRGLKEDHLNWTCYHCSGCIRSDYEKHLKKEPYFLHRSESISFDLDDTKVLRELDYTGISRIQRNGAWNNLRTSTIEVFLDHEDSDYELDLFAEAFVIPGLVDMQQVKVTINGYEAALWQYVSDEQCHKKAIIKKEWILQDGKVEVGLEYLNAISPLELGIGRDDRERAIFIKNIQIK